MDTQERLTSLLVRHAVFLQLFLVHEITVALFALEVVGLLVTHKGCLADEAATAVLALEWPFRLRLVFPLMQQAVRASAVCLLADLATVNCLNGLVGVDSRMTHGLVQLQNLCVAKPTPAGWTQQARDHSGGGLFGPGGGPVALVVFAGT